MLYPPIYRKDFKILTDLRADEARILLSNGKPLGAYYLAGYAVEGALKACIAKKMKLFQFPPDIDYARQAYSHKLQELIRLAGLESQLDKDTKANQGFATNWNTVKDWTQHSRYQTGGLNGKDMYNAVMGKDGVLAWIKLRW